MSVAIAYSKNYVNFAIKGVYRKLVTAFVTVWRNRQIEDVHTANNVYWIVK